jgi:predicted ABC-type transport system involved in lysophospholipase L1 biosynthesis ATPase subunit
MNERALRIAACLGVDSANAERAHTARVKALALEAVRLDATLSPGGVALITGPSGAGKSTLLGLLVRDGMTVVVRPLTRRQMRVRVASLCVRTPLVSWAGLLARFGLAEAGVLVSRAGDLSAGERARLELALAAARCERIGLGCRHPRLCEGGAFVQPVATEHQARRAEPGGTRACTTLMVDEWCSMLDRATAVGVAAGAARWARERGVRLIGATAHDDFAESVEADVVVRLNGQGGAAWTGCGLNKAG